MGVDNLHRHGGFEIETDDIADTTLAGITDAEIVDNFQVLREYQDGSVHPKFLTIPSVSENIRSTTVNIDDALDIVGTQGQCLRGDALKKGLNFYSQKLDKCTAGPAAGSVHKKYNVALKGAGVSSGLIIPQSISINHQQNAQMTFQVSPEGNNGSNGLAKSDGVALPAGLEDNGNRFTMGKIDIDGVEYDGKKSVQLDFGISQFVESADSEIFPEWISIDQIAYLITVRGVDPDWLHDANAVPRAGKAFTHANFAMYFRKRLDSSVGFVADGTAEHIKATAYGRAWVSTLATGSNRRPSETVLQIYPYFDTGNTLVPLTINTLQQIT